MKLTPKFNSLTVGVKPHKDHGIKYTLFKLNSLLAKVMDLRHKDKVAVNIVSYDNGEYSQLYIRKYREGGRSGSIRSLKKVTTSGDLTFSLPLCDELSFISRFRKMRFVEINFRTNLRRDDQGGILLFSIDSFKTQKKVPFVEKQHGEDYPITTYLN